MEEISRLFSEYLNPFLEKLGLHWLAKHSLLLLTVIFVILIPAAHKLIIFLLERRKKKILRKNLYPFFDSTEISNATKYYVKTYFQNVDPANDDEMRLGNAFSAKQVIIPFLIKKSFNSNSDQKYFIVLGDSGMGKTTMLINLYYAYLRSMRRTYEIKLLPLGSKDIDDDIEAIPSDEKQKTILLLDAFDEDHKAVDDYRTRMKNLLELTKEFRKVIITSRTQFFESAQDEPYETGQLKFGGNKGVHLFYKMYLSPFDDQNVSSYLNKKYGWFNYRTKRLAKQIVDQCPNLIVRPMLLAYIDTLVKEPHNYPYSYLLYEQLIAKWIDREVSRVLDRDRENYKIDLYKFSKAVALDIYYNFQERKTLSINASEIAEIANKYTIDLSMIDLKSKSLLNRNASGLYKFSHKSILEYFLALEIFENALFRQSFNYESMSQAKAFYCEMCRPLVTEQAHRVNFHIPYETTTYHSLVKYLKKHMQIHALKSVESNRSLTILNPAEFDDKFYSGLSNVFYLNILITQKSDIEKIFLLPNLKGLCILNDCSHFRSHFVDIQKEGKERILQYFIDDFKHLITRINPDKEVSGLSGLANKTEPSVHDLNGPLKELNKKLYGIYISTLFVCVRTKINKWNPNLMFYQDPVTNEGKMIGVL